MTNSREMAEQAFSLLQSALEASETQCRELAAKFETERPAQSQVESELDSLAARVERAEEERTLWRKTANQLQDVVANERAKLKRLTAKLEVAEGNDDKSSRKEINFWRQKAEDFAESKRRYQERIAALKNELHASQDELERIQRAGQEADTSAERLRELLEEREQQIMQLAASVESGILAAESLQERIDDQAREIANLSNQLMETEAARNEACRAYDLFDAEVRDLRVQCATSDQIMDSLRQDLDAAQSKLASIDAERDSVIGSLETQHEREIAELRAQTEEALAALRSEHDGAMAALLMEHESALEALRTQNQSQHADTQAINEQALAEAAARHEAVVSELQAQQHEAMEALKEQHASALLQQSAAHVEELQRASSQHTSALDEVQAQHANALEALRLAHAQDMQAQAAGLSAALEDAASAHAAATTALEARHGQQLDAAAARHDGEMAELRAANEAALAAMDERFRDDLAELRSAHQSALVELETQHQNTLTQLKTGHQQQTDELSTSARLAVAELESAYVGKLAELEARLAEAEEQVAGLDHELSEEKLRADNLNELANEKREEAALMTEKFEEMQERYEETKWKLGKAKHFEKLVRRRKKLIGNLITTIRARQKANNTLKAGLDSLRKYKANADQRQQELLRKIETLENALSEARERIGQHQAKRPADRAPAAPPSEELLQLRKQISAQTDIIQNLEADLRRARKAENESRTKSAELERLHDDIATKNTFIGALQKDIDEKQRAEAQLRKRDIELRNLNEALAERDRQIGSLSRENESLRAAKAGETGGIDRTKLAEYEKSINQMANTIKEYKTTITTLNDAVDKWKRKYEFLAADAPYGYDSAGEK